MDGRAPGPARSARGAPPERRSLSLPTFSSPEAQGLSERSEPPARAHTRRSGADPQAGADLLEAQVLEETQHQHAPPLRRELGERPPKSVALDQGLFVGRDRRSAGLPA